MSMSKLRFLLILGVISVFTLVGRAQEAPPPHIVGTPDITWGMTPDQVQQFAPGQIDGQVLQYRAQFVTYPSVVEYWFSADAQLAHVMVQPQYVYPEGSPRYQQEFTAISGYLTNVYGQPAKTQEQIMQWTPQNVPTQATLMLFPRGWMTRFDHVQPQR